MRGVYVLCVVGVGACNQHGHDPGIIDPAAATSSILQFAALAMEMDASDMAHAVPTTDTLISDLFLMVSANGNTQAGASEYEPSAGNGTCSPMSCSFDVTRIGPVIDVAFTVTGTIDRLGPTFEFAVVEGEGGHGADIHTTLEGSVSVTATSVDGSLAISYTNASDGTATPSHRDITVDYEGITLDAAGCPVAGSIHAVDANVEGTLEMSGCQ